MKRLLLVVSISVAMLSCASNKEKGVDFDQFFNNQTLRFDYIHSGNATSETFEVKHIIDEGFWVGRRYNLINQYGLGVYFFELYDKATNQLIYSEGYNSVFCEWQTIAEAKEKTLDFNETIRMPWPKNDAKLIVYKRDSVNALVPIWQYDINTADNSLVVAKNSPNCAVIPLLESGSSDSKIDIVILGDGYTAQEMIKYRIDADFFVKSFFSVEPFKSRKADFNVRAVEVVSPNSGIQNPNENFYPNNPLKLSYNTFGVDRYVLTYDDWNFRDYAALAPYDFVVILMNSKKYGGGGIYNLYITAAARSQSNGYVMVHEMGHHIAALADEYYQSEVAYAPANTAVEPWEFNVTALLDKDNIKWKSFLTEGVQIPTPWNKEEYDKSGGKASLLPTNERTVGAFEGANYLSSGMYRSEVNCIMMSKATYFCAACTDGINKVLDLHTSKNEQ